MNKWEGQYIGLFSVIVAYFIIHEGAYLLNALFIGVFKFQGCDLTAPSLEGICF